LAKVLAGRVDPKHRQQPGNSYCEQGLFSKPNYTIAKRLVPFNANVNALFRGQLQTSHSLTDNNRSNLAQRFKAALSSLLVLIACR
jgi:hypothetical protein